MAAADTFEQFVVAQIPHPSPELAAYIAEQRQYLLSLRSEDERQRCVEKALFELKALAAQRK